MHKWGWLILPSLALPLVEDKRIFEKSKHIIIQITLIILITLFLAEVSLRVYNYFNPIFIFYSNSYNRYRAKPYASDYYGFKLNSRGFKDREFTEKNKKIYRIIGIGDSFTFGVVPYKYNYLTLLESQLKEDNYNVEVLNMGIPMICPKDYLALFVREGLDLKPNMLLLTFYVGNDFTDCYRRKKNIFDYSYVASLIKYLVTLETKYKGYNINGPGKYYNDSPTIEKEAYLKLMEQRSFMYFRGDKTIAKLDNSALHYLSLINAICKRKHIDFIVVIAPDEFQINDVLQEEVIKAIYPELNREKWDITLPIKMLTDGLGGLGITYINLYPYFKEESGERLYKPQDTHWNIAGNQLAANIIQTHLLKYLNEYTPKSQ